MRWRRRSRGERRGRRRGGRLNELSPSWLHLSLGLHGLGCSIKWTLGSSRVIVSIAGRSDNVPTLT